MPLKIRIPKPAWQWALAIGLYVLALFLYRYREVWGTPYWGNDDVVQHLTWAWTFGEHRFVEGDPWVAASGLLQPWGYYALIRVLTLFFDPLTVSRIFPVFTLYIACLSVFFLVKRRFGWALGLCAVLMFSNIPMERMAGFMARAFAIPFMLLFLFYWDAGRKKAAAWTAAASALFYPTAFLVLGAFTGLAALWDLISGRFWKEWKRKEIGWLTGCFVAALLILFLKSRMLEAHPLIGPFFPREALLSMPEFAPGGRVDFQSQMDPGLPWKFPVRHYLRLPWPDYTLVLMAVSFVLSWIFLKAERGYYRLVVLFAASGVICFYLAQWLLPRLFQPDRYLYYCLLSAYFLFVIGVIPRWRRPGGGSPSRNHPSEPVSPAGEGQAHRAAGVDSIPRMFTRRQGPMGGLTIIPAILFLLLTAWSVFDIRSPKESGIYRYGDFAALYDKIKSFDHPVKIAGPTEVTSEIPWFSQASVLFSDEACHALYFTRYHRLIQAPVWDFIRAYTAGSPEPVVRLFKDHQVDYLILDRFFFEHNRMFLFEPFQAEVKRLTEGKKGEDYWLSHAPDSLVLPVDWRFGLLDGKRFLEVYGGVE